MSGNGYDRSSFLVAAEGTADGANGDNSKGDGQPIAASGLQPPAGLFERLDLNHDSVLSESEYKAGWTKFRS